MILVYLGDVAREKASGNTWVEIQIQGWIVDGGAPLLLIWTIALTSAMWLSGRVALRCRDPNISYWAAVIFALNLSVIAACFSFPVFIHPLGMQFWLLTAALYKADRLTTFEAEKHHRRATSSVRATRPASPSSSGCSAAPPSRSSS
jgi:hypothetical protein